MMRTTTTLLLAIVLFASCNQFQKTPSGLSYKISKGGSKEKLRQGQFVKFNIEYKVPPKDSVLTSSYDHVPAYMVIDTSRPGKHSFLEIITLCSVGDKIDFVMSVDSLKKLGMIEYNNIFHERDLIKGRVEILKTFPSQDDATADLQKELDIEKGKEIKDIQAFTTKAGVKTQSTPSGAFVEIINAGDAIKADSGMQTKVLYRGSVIGSKVEFDFNMDKNGKPVKDPLLVNVGLQGGNGAVIKGLDEALRFFGKGGKGKVYIPAMLGYGQNGQPPVIPAYANLVFDFEVLEVAKPPAPLAQPGLPGAQQSQKKKK